MGTGHHHSFQVFFGSQVIDDLAQRPVFGARPPQQNQVGLTLVIGDILQGAVGHLGVPAQAVPIAVGIFLLQIFPLTGYWGAIISRIDVEPHSYDSRQYFEDFSPKGSLLKEKYQ